MARVPGSSWPRPINLPYPIMRIYSMFKPSIFSRITRCYYIDIDLNNNQYRLSLDCEFLFDNKTLVHMAISQSYADKFYQIFGYKTI